ELQEQEEICHAVNRSLALAYTHGLYENGIVACGFTQNDGLPRFLSHPAQGISRWRRSDVGIGMLYQLFHPGFVAQDTASRNTAARIHCQHRYLSAHIPKMRSEGF